MRSTFRKQEAKTPGFNDLTGHFDVINSYQGREMNLIRQVKLNIKHDTEQSSTMKVKADFI